MRLSCQEYVDRFGFSLPINFEVPIEWDAVDAKVFATFNGYVDLGVTHATLHIGQYEWELWRKRVTDPTILDIWRRLDRKRLKEGNDDRASLVRSLGDAISEVYNIPATYVVAVLSQPHPIVIEGVIDRAFDKWRGFA